MTSTTCGIIPLSLYPLQKILELSCRCHVADCQLLRATCSCTRTAFGEASLAGCAFLGCGCRDTQGTYAMVCSPGHIGRRPHPMSQVPLRCNVAEGFLFHIFGAVDEADNDLMEAISLHEGHVVSWEHAIRFAHESAGFTIRTRPSLGWMTWTCAAMLIGCVGRTLSMSVSCDWCFGRCCSQPRCCHCRR